MREIFGQNVSVSISQHDLQSQWNDFMKNRLIIFGEEVAGLGEKNNTANYLKSVTTDRELHIRTRHKNSSYYNNFATLFLFSNDPEPIRISKDDRRYVVYEPKKSPKEIFDTIYSNLERTALVLANYLSKVHLVQKLEQYKNESRLKLIGVSKNYVETLVDEINTDFRLVLKNAQGKNKTNNKIPTLEEVDSVHEYTTELTKQSTNSYCAEIKQNKDGEESIYIYELYFVL